MNASELFKKGLLGDAVAAQTAAVKGNPADQNARLFLFELLVFAGDLERAQKHIDALQYDDLPLAAAVETYRRAVMAEQARRRFFDDGVPPELLQDSPRHVELRIQAVQALRGGDRAEAARLLREAQDASPPVRGTLNGKPFDLLRDCDDLLGNVLEILMQDRYVWLPVEQIERLVANPPRFPRDLIWIPARLETKTSGQGAVFVSALYPRTYADADDQVRLGRRTEFSDSEPVLGRGAKLFLAGEDAVPLQEWRELTVAG